MLALAGVLLLLLLLLAAVAAVAAGVVVGPPPNERRRWRNASDETGVVDTNEEEELITKVSISCITFVTTFRNESGCTAWLFASSFLLRLPVGLLSDPSLILIIADDTEIGYGCPPNRRCAAATAGVACISIVHDESRTA